MERRYLSIKELSEYLGIPKYTIYSWTSMKKIPYVKLGRAIRFDMTEIESWIKERKVEVLDFYKKR
jgi:excisionase family DNA binding protein